MDDFPTRVKAKEDEEQALYERMQQDADLLYLKDYVLSDTKGHAVPDIVNVTLNKPAVFAANVMAALGSVKQQVIVESDNKSIDTSAVEAFQTAAFGASNYRLMRRGLPLLNPFADAQLAFRGRTARRVLFREEEGETIADIMPWDGRYVRYAMDKDGVVWAAYRMERAKEDIEAEYGVIVKGKTAKVLDCWDRWHNEVWIDGKMVWEEPHIYGETPVVVEVVPLGYGAILLDSNRIKHEGESIFFLMRGVMSQLNMLISILQTLNLKLVKAPQQYASKEGKDAEPPEYEDATGSGSITSVDIGGGILPVTYGDASNAATLAYNLMEKAVQEGGYTDIDVGNVHQPFSAVALITIGESKDQVYLPRLAAKENLNVQTAQMFTRQVLKIGGTIKLSSGGRTQTFSAAQFAGEYTTSYKYFVKSPKTDIARMSVAQAAEKWYPRRYVLSEVLQVEDVDRVEREWKVQEAELLSPNVRRHRAIMALLENAEQGDQNAGMEAKIMAQELGVTIDQMKMGVLEKAVEQVNQTGQSEVPPLMAPPGQMGGTKPKPGMQQNLPLPEGIREGVPSA